MAQPISLSKHHLIFELQPNSYKAQTTVTLRNVEDARQVYKIKTTSQGRYTVRPSIGLLEPFASAKVDIFLILPENDRKLDTIKDTFCVFSLPAVDKAWDKNTINQFMNENIAKARRINFTTSIAKSGDKQPRLSNSDATTAPEGRTQISTSIPNPSLLHSAYSASLPDEFAYIDKSTRKSIFHQQNSLEKQSNNGKKEFAEPVINYSQRHGSQRGEESVQKEQKLLSFAELDGSSNVNVRLKQKITQLEGELKILKVF